ncbi:acyl-CoA/acyl-ACP dehydrogenase [Actinomadura madurae]|nr:acyl-CoA dehydrogenase family protein [Actinomadura madurae]MCP9979048.1 acyl-CoA/acyl-ACP dehydrogenase [Actinomadura madurae]
MDFALPDDLIRLLADLDAFIEREILPLQAQDDNERFFDHRREYARTDFENGGVPRPEWEELLGEMFRRADAAGWLRYGLPGEVGGSGGTNLDMAVIREHLAHRGLGLHNDLQNESSVVGNFPFVHMLLEYGTPEQKEEFLEPMLAREKRIGFGLTEPDHGSDATWMETTAVRDGGDWVLNGAKRFNSGMHSATHDVVFARTSGEPGDARGITAFFVPARRRGVLRRLPLVDAEHAHRPRRGHHPGRARARLGGLRRRGRGARGGADVRAREPHPAGRVRCRRRAVLHRPQRRLRAQAADVRAAAGHPAGDPVAPGRAADRGGDAARPRPQDGLGTGPDPAPGDQRPGVDVQLPGQPVRVRGGRPGDAGARRPRLHPPHPVRAHLPAPSPLPDHRGGRGGPDAEGGRLPVRVRPAPAR